LAPLKKPDSVVNQVFCVY